MSRIREVLIHSNIDILKILIQTNVCCEREFERWSSSGGGVNEVYAAFRRSVSQCLAVIFIPKCIKMTPEGSHVYRIISPGPNSTIKHFCRQVYRILGIRRINNTRWHFLWILKILQ